MGRIAKKLNYFTKAERALWCVSVALILVFFVVFDRAGYLTLAASLIGVTSLIFNAKGSPFGQLLMLIFSLLYGIVSYTFAYYGEMISYLGMSAPMAAFALVSWLKNPYKGNKAEVSVHRLRARELIIVLVLAVPVTVGFYFILAHFNTANLIPSTVSITTSFIAVCLTALRSPFFALAYAANDVVLIILWALAALSDVSYLSMLICFIVFLVNDIYGYINWSKMQKRQEKGAKK